MSREEQFAQILERVCGRNIGCLVCYAGSHGNWLVELQDALEDMGVSVEEFASTRSDQAGILFTVTRGRLRLLHPGQCVDSKAIMSIFLRLEKAED